ncbi:dolichyldiphosphatase [Geosmithia morbida]|uniref:Dolichyldiphosphatase n=1 Tax=Geosmithia morbida TaxID=1094350 RepID=A0A9P4YNB0_9HYPO|nr:dolichyldiphosphatase [Geosmithia morbida]KAF4119607.1 dolichyldiphosphatase [Geosmithia morbida]
MEGGELGPLASLSITHVYYDPDDRLSLACAYLALLPQALCVVYVTLIMSTREVEIALTFLGQLACEALNFVLKRLIKEERPARIHGKGYGMPSSHAQFVAFWSASVALFLFFRHRSPTTSSTSAASTSTSSSTAATATAAAPPPPRKHPRQAHHRPWSTADKAILTLASGQLAGLVAWSRVYLNYHTTRQVVAGGLTGVACAVAWFVVTAVARRSGWLAWAVDLPVFRMARVRDLIVEEDMCQAGWEKWEARRMQEAKKES